MKLCRGELDMLGVSVGESHYDPPLTKRGYYSTRPGLDLDSNAVSRDSVQPQESHWPLSRAEQTLLKPNDPISCCALNVVSDCEPTPSHIWVLACY